MPAALLLVRLLLAGIFALSGLSKLFDLAGTRRAVRDFGVPEQLTKLGGVLLPIVELSTSVLLLMEASAWAGAIAALALLTLFSAGISVTLARGRHPACHCFGRLSSAPVGWRTLVRNVPLAGLAGFIVLAGHEHPGIEVLGRLGGRDMAASVGLVLGAAGLALTAITLWFLLQVVAQNGRQLARLDGLEQRLMQGNTSAAFPATQETAEPAAGLPIGTPAPAFQLPGLHGETLTLEALRATGKPTLLAFTEPGCGPCITLLPDLARWQRELSGTVALAVVSRGSADDNRAKVAEHGLTQVLLQQDREVAQTYLAHGAPSMVLVRPDGTIGSALAQGAEQIRALVARTMGTPAPPAVIPVIPAGQQGQPCPNCGRVHGAESAAASSAVVAVGQAAPVLKLPDLDGNTVDLADYRGRETVLLFWNPDCGFCQQMLPDLKAWEITRPATAPALLVVSSGTPDAMRAHGLRSTVLLDAGSAAGPAFGANGTPMAVHIDVAGAVVSTPVAGAEAVFALLGGRVVSP